MRNLLRRDETPDLTAMIRRTIEGFQFLGALTDLERIVAADQAMQARAEAAELMAHVVGQQP